MIHVVGEPEKNPSHLILQITPPEFIRKELPFWKVGNKLPDKITAKIFSQDPKTLFEIKNDWLIVLAQQEVKPLQSHLTEDELLILTSLLNSNPLEVDDGKEDIPASIPDFSKYKPILSPMDRMELCLDYQYIWSTHRRIRNGKSKSDSTIVQYSRLLFDKTRNSLFNYLQSSGMRMGDLLFPSSQTSTAITAWTVQYGNASSESKIL